MRINKLLGLVAAACLGVLAGLASGAGIGGPLTAQATPSQDACPSLYVDPTNWNGVVLHNGPMPPGGGLSILAPEMLFKDQLDCGQRAYAPRFRLTFSQFHEIDPYRIEFQDAGGVFRNLLTMPGTTIEVSRDHNGNVYHHTVNGPCFTGDEWPAVWRVSNGSLGLTRISHVNMMVLCCGCQLTGQGICINEWKFDCSDERHSTAWMPFATQCDSECSGPGRHYTITVLTCDETTTPPRIAVEFDSGASYIFDAQGAGFAARLWSLTFDTCEGPTPYGTPMFARVWFSEEEVMSFKTSTMCCELASPTP